MKQRVHHRVPYPDLSTTWYDFFTDNGIFPEIYFSAEHLDQIHRDQLLALEKDLHSRNLSLSLHAPFHDLSPGALDEKIREATHFRLKQILDVAEILKPNIVDIHAHYDRHRFGGKVDLWVDTCAKTLDAIVKRAEKLKVILAVENVFDEEPAAIDRLIVKVGSPSLQACFDNGHFHIFHKVPLKKWWEVLGEKIVLLHLHDNHGDRDEHLPIGDGNFPFPSYFNLLKTCHHEMTYTLESSNLADAKKSLKALKKFFI